MEVHNTLGVNLDKETDSYALAQICSCSDLQKRRKVKQEPTCCASHPNIIILGYAAIAKDARKLVSDSVDVVLTKCALREQISKHRRMFHRLTFFACLEWKVAFDSVYRTALTLIKGSAKNSFHLSSLEIQTTEVEFVLMTIQHGKQCLISPPSPFLVNSVSGTITEIALLLCGNSGTDIWSVKKLSHPEYLDDIVLVSEYPSKLQAFILRPKDSIVMFGMCLKPTRCKMLLQNWTARKPNLVCCSECPRRSRQICSREQLYLIMWPCNGWSVFAYTKHTIGIPQFKGSATLV